MNAYTYINACDAIGPAIHKNGLFYGREADFTRSVHEIECFYGRAIVSGAKWSRATAFGSASKAHRPAPRPENSRWSKPIAPRGFFRAHRPAPLCPEEKRRSHRQSSLSAGNRKQGRKKRKLRSSIVSVPKPPRLPPWRAGRRRCPCRRDGPGGSGVSRRSLRPGR